jgi:hypothetical protein
LRNWEDKLRRGDTTVESSTSGPTHPLLEEKRAQVEALNNKLADLRHEQERPERDAERYQNQLDDAQARIIQMEERLRFGDFGKKSGNRKAVSDELQSLRDQVKGLNKAIAKGRSDMEKPRREAERAARELVAAKKAVADLEAKLARGDLSLKSKPARTVPDELKAERAKLKELNKQLKAARTAAKVRPPEEVKRREAFKRRVQRELADLRMRRVSGNYETRTRSPAQIKHDAESENLAANLRQEKHAWEVEKERLRLANRKTFETFFDNAIGITRGGKLTRFMTDIKLIMYSLYHLGAQPFREAAGALAGRLPGTENARIEGRFSLKALGKFYSGFFGKGMKDALEALNPVASIVTRGKVGDIMKRSDMKNILAESAVVREGAHLEPRWYDIPQVLHEVIKSPLRRAAFEYAVQKETEYREAHGLDSTSKEARAEIIREAGREAQRKILMADNAYADMINRGLSRLGQVDKATGHAKPHLKAAEFVGRSIATFNRVAANHFVELVNTVLGVPIGGGRLLYKKAFGEGLSHVSVEDANSIVRQIKQGSFGAAFFLLGLTNPQMFGGLNHPKKKNDDEPGFAEMQIGDIRVPRVVSLANPLLLAAHVGATITRLANTKLRQKDTDTQGLAGGLEGAAQGVLETGPLISELPRLGKVLEPGGLKKWSIDWLHSNLEPGMMQEIAQFLDRKDGSLGQLLNPANPSVKRKAADWLDEFKIDVPGLRQDVPEQGKK